MKLLAFIISLTMFVPLLSDFVTAQSAKTEKLIDFKVIIDVEIDSVATAAKFEVNAKPADKSIYETLGPLQLKEVSDDKPQDKLRVYTAKIEKISVDGNSVYAYVIKDLPEGKYSFSISKEKAPDGYKMSDGPTAITSKHKTPSFYYNIDSSPLEIAEFYRNTTTYLLLAKKKYMTMKYDPKEGEFPDGDKNIKSFPFELYTSGISEWTHPENITPKRAGYKFKGWEVYGMLFKAGEKAAFTEKDAGITAEFTPVWESLNSETTSATTTETTSETTTETTSAATSETTATTTETTSETTTEATSGATSESTAITKTTDGSKNTTKQSVTTKTNQKVASTGVSSVSLVGVMALIGALGTAYFKKDN